MLLDAGADGFATDAEGKTALAMAKSRQVRYQFHVAKEEL